MVLSLIQKLVNASRIDGNIRFRGLTRTRMIDNMLERTRRKIKLDRVLLKDGTLTTEEQEIEERIIDHFKTQQGHFLIMKSRKNGKKTMNLWISKTRFIMINLMRSLY